MPRSNASIRASAAPSSRPGSRNGKLEPSIEEDAPATVRRSGRARKAPTKILPGERDNDRDDKSPTYAKSVAKDEQRRNVKRKAAPEVFDVPDDIIDKALSPMQPDELDEWDAWVELESDPAFFNLILQHLGVKDVKIQELFSVDEGSLSILPKPVHGLIFLYQYVEEDAQEESENGKNVWFANQTTDNACATLALFNIIMNAEDIELGDRLKAFKEASTPLVPALRGDLLSNTAWIRNTHNQFARRLDLLNADLALEQEAKAAAKKKKAARPAKRRKTKPSTDAAFHFIAYVPVGSEVYQLDGLEKAPLSIGKVDEHTGHWTDVARPFIETRMLQYESEQLSFNLLAVCKSPLSQLREELVTSITEWARVQFGMSRIDHELGQNYALGMIFPRKGIRFTDYGLPEYLPYNINTPPHPIELAPLDPNDDTLIQKLRARREELESEQARLMAEYRSEAAMLEEENSRANGRKKDYTPFIHQWVQKLAEQGALQDIAEEVAAR
ncbi:ubiquitin carboxyl-terminal hydrolase, family 1, partial [Coniochaeta sp. 2T2.1]